MTARTRRHLLTLAPAIVLLLSCAVARAHGDEEVPENMEQLRSAWAFEPGICIPLVLSAWLYTQGVVRAWRSSGVGRGVRVSEAASFAGGWLALVVALVSPLHPWGRALFSAHMAQHEILMLVAAPLLVLGRPVIAFLRALPQPWATALARWSNTPWWSRLWQLLSNALVAWLIHAVILWVWHAPALMNAVIDNEWVHAAQHVSFLLSALLFWWAVVHGHRRALGYGMAVLYMFTTALHSGLLGVLMTFSTHLWYPAYANTTQSWGLTPLEDQQLGGLIMWIPAGVIYIVAGLALLAGWLRESELRATRRPPVATATATGVVVPALLLALTLLSTGCDQGPTAEIARSYTHGDEHRGRDRAAAVGCTSCHTIPGLDGAVARVGPPLDHIASRSYIGPGLPNTPDNMITWLRHPHAVEPKAAMPDLHLSDQDARDIACYLYTLR